jgi:predicted Zn-dependent protease with MMP-like domain
VAVPEELLIEQDDCITCGGSSDAVQDRCRKSKRACGHHCNHIWTHDICHWCGLEIGDEGELIEPDEA